MDDLKFLVTKKVFLSYIVCNEQPLILSWKKSVFIIYCNVMRDP